MGDVENLPIKCLYHFSSDGFDLFEIKRQDLDDTYRKGDLYKWFYCSQESGHLVELKFQEMGTKDTKAFRKFSEASLLFDDRQGEFELSGTKINLTRNAPEDISKFLLMAVKDYLETVKVEKEFKGPNP